MSSEYQEQLIIAEEEKKEPTIPHRRKIVAFGGLANGNIFYATYGGKILEMKKSGKAEATTKVKDKEGNVISIRKPFLTGEGVEVAV